MTPHPRNESEGEEDDQHPPTTQAAPSTRKEPGTAGDKVTLEAVEGAEFQNKFNKRKHIRKKKKGTGWEKDRVEPAPHEADQNRYDPTLPFDQRLLRAVDEFRSLRSIPPDFKLSVDSLLSAFGIDTGVLRQKYGRQPLRGFVPEVKKKVVPSAGFGGEGESDEEEEGKIVELLEDSSELEWGTKTLNQRAIARWLDARANDGYTPTLTTAPTVMSSFLRFLLVRNVLPLLTNEIRPSLKVAETALSELASSQTVFRQLVFSTPFHRALRTLFPSSSSTLISPLPLHDPVPPPSHSTPAIPEVFSSLEFANIAGIDQAQLDEDTVPLAGGEDEWNDTSRGGDLWERVKLIKKKMDEEARLVEAWNKEDQSEEEAVVVLRNEFKNLGGLFAVQEQGVWKVAYQERSARKIVKWEKVYSQLAASATSVRGDALFKLHLSPHLESFPVTSSSTTFIPTTSPPPYSLTKPISILIPESVAQSLQKETVFEADYTRIVLCPTSTPPSKTTQGKEIVILSSLYRILPSYWELLGDELRDEPGRPRSIQGGWTAPGEGDGDGENGVQGAEKEKEDGKC